jgi:Tfp pilus assembly protein PilF
MQFSFVADHFQYLASIAVLAGVAWIVATRTDVVYGTILVVGMAVLSWQQCGIYHDRETLWRDTVAKNPGSSLAQTSLGNELGARGAHVQAERRHRAAIAIDSTYADAWTNLAVELNAQGRDSEALDAAREAVRQADWLPVARLNLALGLAAVERYDEAVAQLHRAVKLDERFVAAWVQLARVQWLRNDPAAANQAIQHIRQFDPALAEQLARELAREQAQDQARDR